jgi:hypothetical protein
MKVMKTRAQAKVSVTVAFSLLLLTWSLSCLLFSFRRNSFSNTRHLPELRTKKVKTTKKHKKFILISHNPYQASQTQSPPVRVYNPRRPPNIK